MALGRIAHFDWERILNKVESTDVKRTINLLRGKANEIATSSGKFVKPAAPIDFGSYKSKLKFTSAAVDSLEAVYKNTKLPQFSASLSSLEQNRRAAMLEVVKSTVAAAHSELELLNGQLAVSEQRRFNKDTSTGQTMDRFPILGKEVEEEIKTHQWLRDT